jgi:hypothetical protein
MQFRDAVSIAIATLTGRAAGCPSIMRRDLSGGELPHCGQLWFYKKGCQEKKLSRELEAAKNFGIQAPLAAVRILEKPVARNKHGGRIFKINAFQALRGEPATSQRHLRALGHAIGGFVGSSGFILLHGRRPICLPLLHCAAGPAISVRPEWALRAYLSFGIIDPFLVRAAYDSIRHDDRLRSMMLQEPKDAASDCRI